MKRYFARFRAADGTIVTAPFGRYRNAEEAELAGKAKFQSPHAEFFSSRCETGSEAFGFKAARFVIRGLRIAVATAAAWVAYVLLLEPAGPVFDTPFSSLTLGMIIGTLTRMWGAGIILYVCWHIAFGEGTDY